MKKKQYIKTNQPTLQDSLDLRNNAQQVLDYYQKTGNYKLDPLYEYEPRFKKSFGEDLDTDLKYFNGLNSSRYPTKDPNHIGSLSGLKGVEEGKLPESVYRKQIDQNRLYQREAASGILDTRSPMTLYDYRIPPQLDISGVNINKKDPMYGDAINVPVYDPIAVTPVSMLTPKEKEIRLKKYGIQQTNIPKTNNKKLTKEQISKLEGSSLQIFPEIGSNKQLNAITIPDISTKGHYYREPVYGQERIVDGKVDIPKSDNGKKIKTNPPIYGTKQQYQAYQDSLNAYNTGERYDRLNRLYGQDGEYYKTSHKPTGRKHIEGMAFGEENLPENYYSAKGLPIADISKYYDNPDVSPSYRIQMDRNVSGMLPSEEGMREVKKWSHAFDNYKAKPEYVKVAPDKEAYLFLPHYKKPVQPIIAGEQINKLPYTDQPLPTDIQYNPQEVYIDPEQFRTTGHHYFAGTYGVPSTVDGKIDVPKQENGGKMEKAKSGFKINPKHKGYCTPMTKATCTGKRRTFALNAKRHFKKKAEEGMQVPANIIQIPGPQAIQYTPNITTNQLETSLNASSLNNDPIAQQQMMKPQSGLPGVTPDIIDQYKSQPESHERTRPTFQGPSFGIDTGNLVSGLAQGINALIPQTPIKDNQKKLIEAYNPHPQGTGSHATFENGGYISRKGKKLTKAKAKEMLHDKTAHGHPLTEKQRKYFGAIASGYAEYGGAYPNGGQVTPEQIQAINTYMKQHDPNYGSQNYNYGKFATPMLEQFNRENPNMALSISDVDKYQQYIQDQYNLDPMRVSAPQGLSPVEGKYGPKTQTSSLRNWELVTMKGNKVMSDQMFGPHPEALVAANTPSTTPIEQNNTTTLPQVNKPTSTGLDFTQGVSGTQYNPYSKQPRHQTKVQKSNWHTSEPTNYSIDSIRSMENGGYIPQGKDGLFVENNQVSKIGDNDYTGDTLKFHGPSHEEGGIQVAYDGKPVEVEGGETAFIDRSGDFNILGNLKIPGTNMKFKKAGEQIAKEEQKTKKIEKRGTYLLNTNHPHIDYESLSFNTGKVLHDSAIQREQEAGFLKEGLANVQNKILEHAERTNQDPKNVVNGLKAAYGKKIRKAEDGNKEKKDIAYSQVFNEKTGQMEFVPDTPYQNYGNTYEYNNPVNVSNTNDYSNTPFRFDKESVSQEQDNLNLTPQHIAWTLRNQEKIQPLELAPLQSLPTPTEENKLKEISQDQFPKLPSTKTATKYKNIRNKIGLGDVLPEIAAMLDKPVPVPSQQFTPQLLEPYKVSFQDQLNANTADFKATEKALMHNPAALGALNAQRYDQNSKVLGEQFRVNQGIENQITNQNISLINQAKETNMKLADEQLVRQMRALENTRANRFAGAASLTDKIAQNKAQNTQMKLYEELYNYGYIPGEGFIHEGDPYKVTASPSSVADISAKERKRKKTTDSTGKTTETDEEKESYYGGKMMMGGMMAMRGMGSPNHDYKKKKHKKYLK